MQADPRANPSVISSGHSRYEQLNDVRPCQAQPDPVVANIKAVWGRLTDDEIALYTLNREQFFARLKEKYGLSHEQAQEQIRMIEASCGPGLKVVQPAA